MTPASSTAQQQSSRPLGPANASWLSAMMLFGPLSLFAEGLLAHTNHRPLGAATFASVAVVLWLFAEFISRYLLDARVSPERAQARKIAWIVCTIVSVAVLCRGFL